MKYRIGHISDLHIGCASDFLRGADPMQRLCNILTDLKDQEVDTVWITGDLTNNVPRSVSTYESIKRILDDLNLSRIILAGNHDDPQMLGATFHPDWSIGQLCYGRRDIAGRILLVLDSSRGRLTSSQWDWLRDIASNTRGDRPIILMHHPPIYAHSCYMDNHYPFIEQDEFLELCDHWSQVDVFCGHYHHGIDITHGHIHVHVAPSALFQVGLDPNEFSADGDTYGYQLVTLCDHDHTTVTRRYLSS